MSTPGTNARAFCRTGAEGSATTVVKSRAWPTITRLARPSSVGSMAIDAQARAATATDQTARPSVNPRFAAIRRSLRGPVGPDDPARAQGDERREAREALSLRNADLGQFYRPG